MENTEIVKVVRSKVENAVESVGKLKVRDDKELAEAAATLTDLKKLEKFVGQEKEKITKPLNEALKAARSLFAPFEEKIGGAMTTIKKAMAIYQVAKEKEQAKKEESIARRVESGQLKEETGLRKMEELGEVKTNLKTGEGTVTFRTVKKVRFGSLSHLKGEELQGLAATGYIEWNQVKARKDALAGLLTVGVEVYEEKEVAAAV